MTKVLTEKDVKKVVREILIELGFTPELISVERTIIETMNQRFAEMREDVNRRFEEMRQDMDKRFELLVQQTDKRFNTLTWTTNIWFILIATLMTIFRFFIR